MATTISVTATAAATATAPAVSNVRPADGLVLATAAWPASDSADAGVAGRSGRVAEARAATWGAIRDLSGQAISAGVGSMYPAMLRVMDAGSQSAPGRAGPISATRPAGGGGRPGPCGQAAAHQARNVS